MVNGSGKTNVLLNLIYEHDDIDKIYLYAKDLSEPKYEFLIKKRKDVGTNHFNYSKAFTGFQIQSMTFIRILMTTIQAKKEKF